MIHRFHICSRRITRMVPSKCNNELRVTVVDFETLHTVHKMLIESERLLVSVK